MAESIPQGNLDFNNESERVVLLLSWHCLYSLVWVNFFMPPCMYVRQGHGMLALKCLVFFQVGKPGSK